MTRPVAPQTTASQREFDDGLRFEFAPVPFRNIVITSPIGSRVHPTTGEIDSIHSAVDIRAPEGTVYLAVKDGIIAEVDNDGIGNCGISVSILHKHNNKIYRTKYCHLKPGSPSEFKIVTGLRVKAGQAIGRSGTTGRIDGPHLHLVFDKLTTYTADIDNLTQTQLQEFLNFPKTNLDAEPFLRQLALDGRVNSVTLKNGTTAYRSPNDGPSTGNRVETGTVSPNIGSLESFHPNIQYELTRRRVSAETANVYMPFVQLTSLTNVLDENLGDGVPIAWCPTLGPHGQNKIEFDDIYLPQSNKSIVGYATAFNPREDNFSRVPVLVKDTRRDQSRIPMPGIVEMSTERSTAGPMGVRGGLMKADIKIRAYSVGQVDALLRYFLRPATRVVLEMGRMSATQSEQKLRPFNWKQRNDVLKELFTELIYDGERQREFIDEYIYGNNGNYEVYLGYVVKFTLKVNKDNIYDIGLTVYSVQQYELPTSHTGAKALCPDATNPCQISDVRTYFAEEHADKPNSFSKLLQSATDDQRWASHVVPIDMTTDGTDPSEYYVSWKFFVEKILNDDAQGIISVVPNDDRLRLLMRMGLLRTVQDPTPIDVSTGITDGQLIANQVGYHPNLRSTDPDVMIIYNQTAQNSRTLEERNAFTDVTGRAVAAAKREERESVRNKLSNDRIFNEITRNEQVGAFTNTTANANNNQSAAGSLTNGIWINTKAIKLAFTQSDTITTAISALLTQMNNATEGYWNLQVYSSDRPSPGLYVIDMGLSKNPTSNMVDNQGKLSIDPEFNSTTDILNSVGGVKPERYYRSSTEKDKPKYLYMFNRGTLRLQDGELGSDILDMNVEFNLPQVIAVQAIAGVGGVAQKGTLQSIDIPELQRISMINTFATCDPIQKCITDVCPPDGQVASDLARAQEEVRRQSIIANKFIQKSDIAAPVALRRLDEARQAEQRAVAAYNNAIAAQSVYAANQSSVISRMQGLTNLGKLLELIEFSPSLMLKKLNIDSADPGAGRPRPYAHAFNSSNLTKTIVSVTLPGIGGIELFQSFLVDRVPSILDRGFYIVTKVIHKFSSEKGWTSTIEGRFRFRPTDEKTTEQDDVCPPGAPTLAVATPVDNNWNAEKAEAVLDGLGSFGRSFQNIPIIGSLFRNPPR